MLATGWSLGDVGNLTVAQARSIVSADLDRERARLLELTQVVHAEDPRRLLGRYGPSFSPAATVPPPSTASAEGAARWHETLAEMAAVTRDPATARKLILQAKAIRALAGIRPAEA